MSLVVKVYENIWSPVPYDQFDTDAEVNIVQDIDGFDQATMQLASFGIKEYNKIEIYQPAVPDVLLFRGYVDEIMKELTIYNQRTSNNSALQVMTITCKGDKATLLKRLWLDDDNDFDGSTIQEAVEAVLAPYNLVGENWTVESDFSELYDISIKQGDNVYDFIDELMDIVVGHWTVEDGKILMKTTLGENKTTGDAQVNVIFNGSQESNVSKITITETATRTNFVLGKNEDEGFYTALNIDDGIVYGAQVIDFRDSNLIVKTENALAAFNIRQRALLVETDPSATINANLGDRLNLILENIPGQVDITGQVLVVKKEIGYNFGKLSIKLSLAENVLQDNSLGGIISRIKKDVDRQIIDN